MTKEQFLAMCEWLTTRTMILIEMRGRSSDTTFVNSRLKEIAELDADAYRALVAKTDKED